MLSVYVPHGACLDRVPVTPGVRMYILCQKVWERHHRLCCRSQGVVDGNIVFETDIIGTVV